MKFEAKRQEKMEKLAARKAEGKDLPFHETVLKRLENSKSKRVKT